MKRISIPLVAVLGALAVVAFVGAASASASTVLCEVNESPCSAGHTLPAGTEVGGYGTDFEKTLEIKAPSSFQCKGGIIGAKTTKESGSPLTATGFSYHLASFCTVAGTTCTEATSSTPPTTISASGGGFGTVTYGSEGQPLTFRLSCGNAGTGFFTCQWGSSSATLWATPETYGTIGTGASFTLEEKIGVTSGVFCGKVGSTAKVIVTSNTVEGRYIEFG